MADAHTVGGARDRVAQRSRDARPRVAHETDRGGHEGEEHPGLPGRDTDRDHDDEDRGPDRRPAEERRTDHAAKRQVHDRLGRREVGVELGREELVDALADERAGTGTGTGARRLSGL